MIAEPHLLADFPDQPLVVCLGGAGGLWSEWLPIAHHLHQRAHVVSVQRTEGLTSLATAANGVAQIIDRQPSDSAVLVAHSMGGFVAEALARLRPELVSGLVLVDGSVATRPTTLSSITERAIPREFQRFNNTLQRLGARPIVGPLIHKMTEPRSASVDHDRRPATDRLAAAGATWDLLASDLANYEPWQEQLLTLRKSHPLPQIAVTVITALPSHNWSRSWARQQDGVVRALRREGTALRVRHVVLRGAPHQVQLTHPSEVADEISALL
ncbi:MAG TPA: alpha/beta hydrolase [Marmoricola sp.]|nr:alpha/beta hydrolase [Nocardioidaceae bacterium]MCB8993401.1 alpha/beta hydrolase [Nocardioidaceae bacterium]MCO5324795.1 alpha/beta hydrolase [Nocardioidaceae bacterium]HMY08141.1 alpha/beta hydrolase [Marmoricola sp.]HRV69568.1 alpha/beta hydrolase [Marmoricola sp.]